MLQVEGFAVGISVPKQVQLVQARIFRAAQHSKEEKYSEEGSSTRQSDVQLLPNAVSQQARAVHSEQARGPAARALLRGQL